MLSTRFYRIAAARLPKACRVFVDGVRVNEAFGDMVNWTSSRRNAIAPRT